MCICVHNVYIFVNSTKDHVFVQPCVMPKSRWVSCLLGFIDLPGDIFPLSTARLFLAPPQRSNTSVSCLALSLPPPRRRRQSLGITERCPRMRASTSPPSSSAL